MPLALRLLAGFVFEVVSAAAVVGVPGAWIVRHADFGRIAAARASDALGRPVTIESLKVEWGPAVTVELDGGTVGSPGGGVPFAVLKHMTAALDRGALWHGAVLLSDVDVQGLVMVLERMPDGAPNWRFGGGPAATPAEQRERFPSLRHVRVRDSSITFVAEGQPLVTDLDDVVITTAADDQPAHLTIAGTYNKKPVSLDGDLQSIDALRDGAKPFGTVLHFASGAARLVFDGTMTDPLNFDGLDGTLRLDTEDSRPVFALAGLETSLDVPVHLDGPFQHLGPLWRLEEVKGQIGQDAVTRAAVDLNEGNRRQPDAVSLDVAFGSLNLNELLGTGAHGKRSGADSPLAASRTPSTLIRAKIAARRLEYDDVAATSVTVEGTQTPGRVAVDSLALEAWGARWLVHGAIEAVGDSGLGRVTADVSTAGAEVQPLAKALGFGALPLSGRIDASVVVDGTARTLDAAAREARISAVVAMRGGSVQKQVVEKASVNVLSLFRTDRGYSAITCALAGVDIRAGVGTVAPLRLRAADGTIAGSARFDLNRRTMDLTIGSERSTTGVFALDIPIRVSGPFSDPSVSPAQWSAQGRAQLAAADSLSALPPALREWARRYPCGPSR